MTDRNSEATAGTDVFVMIHDLLNGDRIPMGAPGDEMDPFEAYAGFMDRSKEHLEAEKADLVEFDADHATQVHVVPAVLLGDGSLMIEGRHWTREAIAAEHGVEAPAP